MADILSQSEIDELLKAMNSGEFDVKEIEENQQEAKVKPYDFRRPNKFSKEQLRTLQMIFENMSRSFTTFLSGYLRTLVQVSIVSVEQITYYEFSNSLTNPVFIAVIDAKPLEGPIILECNNNTTFTIIDKILGGIGASETVQRDYTEIEMGLLTRITTQLLPLIKDAWSNVIELNPEITRIETNSQFTQVISPNETVALCTMSLKINDNEGLINFCLPHITIVPILPLLTTKTWFSNAEKQTYDIGIIKDKISNTYVPLKVVIGTSKITVRDLLSFDKGDVIEINKRYKDPIEVKINDETKFLGVPGIRNKKYCVQITEICSEGDDADE
ncbi:flagellar motor switch protein FliM [Thermoanaerobacterium xylanolyticum LX-11]|uniref:Flagellar motor switch protein FliM n=1 Tax=Thermoanaerobacterium xylanolyticum (strain ATCC 49914 / DSM 7097 / LX-11) TaxID=858215 RepID=F6BFL5_THEXL|nr:flagellar motor switch protein FliM [Thermoanaerobacterium xylanolyticum]AEF17354.1 flagellar motor switch protein FliM [Thermoanaerobacterium xylanolyticum LX-11]